MPTLRDILVQCRDTLEASHDLPIYEKINEILRDPECKVLIFNMIYCTLANIEGIGSVEDEHLPFHSQLSLHLQAFGQSLALRYIVENTLSEGTNGDLPPEVQSRIEAALSRCFTYRRDE